MLMAPLMAQEELVTAEVDYRLARARKQFAGHTHRRHRVPRRTSLRLPYPRRRPLAIA